MRIYRLRCEAMRNPLGISTRHPRLTWIMEAEERNILQTGFRVTVKKDNPQNGQIIFDSGYRNVSDPFIDLTEISLAGRTRYYWDVQVKDNRCRKKMSEEEAWFETGLLDEEDWQAQWIEPEQVEVKKEFRGITGYNEPKQSKEIREDLMNPCQMLRKEFNICQPVKKARIYATAHGIYRLVLNDIRVGDYELAPEATNYNNMLQVQTYDVTGLLKQGSNALGAVLANGWWAGRIGHYGESCQYGNKLALLLQMEVEYEDGTTYVTGTDSSFRSLEGPWRYGELCIGEKYDINLEKKGWARTGYDDSGWKKPAVFDYGTKNLTGQNAPHIRVLERISDPEIYTSPRGEMILDFGQVMAGNAIMHVNGKPGAEIVFRYFEETDQDGNYWFELDGRNSQQTDTLVLGESGEGDYDPWFTYHAFRYIFIESSKGKVSVSGACARLIASDVETTAKIITSNRKVNRLQENIRWTLRSNMTSILTDNPDRERAGWTGDLQMIAPTLFYHTDAQAFIRRWLKEASGEQMEDGCIPIVVPNWPHYQQMPFVTSAGWGDVCVIVPWIMYERYGDERILRECWPMMKKWLRYIQERARVNPEDCGEITPERAERLNYLWNADYNFGDWLTPSACYNEETGEYTYYTQTLCYMMGTYYYAYSSSIMAKSASVLHMDEEEKYYTDLTEKIRQAAIEEIYRKGGILESEYMGAQILALHMGFYPEEDRQKLIDRLTELFRERGMDAGFSSALLISDTFCENGYPELAYDILLDEKFPSWLYEVNQGGTSVWESMQAIMPDGTRNAVSFIQPALCSVGNWMMKGMGGIRPASPGFRKIEIRPYFSDRLSKVDAEYMSVMGKIVCRWEHTESNVILSVEIPANTTAVVTLPGAELESIRESGKILTESEGVLNITENTGNVIVETGSGTYRFVYKKIPCSTHSPRNDQT